MSDSADVSLLVRNQTGHNLIELDSDGVLLPAMEKGEHLIYTLEVSFPLTPGNYSISVDIRLFPNPPHVYGRVFNAFAFEIAVPQGYKTQTGMIRVKPHKIGVQMI